MAKAEHQIQMFYNFDRLASQKIIQAYRILVPEHGFFDDQAPYVSCKKGVAYEDSSHLCTGLIRKTKGRTDNR